MYVLSFTQDKPVTCETSDLQNKMQAQAAATGSDFPRPRHTRRARASRLAPLPAASTASRLAPLPATSTAQAAVAAASAALALLDPPDIVSWPSDDAAAHSQACSRQDFGPAVSGSAEAKACSQHQESCQGNEGDADEDAAAQQPREGTPVSSNRRHFRVSQVHASAVAVCTLTRVSDCVAQS